MAMKETDRGGPAALLAAVPSPGEARPVDHVEFTMAAPKASGKARARRAADGHFYTPAQTAAAETAVAAAFLDAVRLYTLDEIPTRSPVQLVVLFSRQLPRSAPPGQAGRPDLGKPDVDNVLKLVMDALTGLAWEDDSQVYEVRAARLPLAPHGSGDRLHVYIGYR